MKIYIQVDGSLQGLMNENSIDYMAKFADLAAEITANHDQEDIDVKCDDS